MTIEDVPRTLVYKDFETVADILGSGSERTLEQEFYDRLIKRPFIESLDYPPKWICTIFNNARYIYYLVKTEDDDPSLCFNFYLAKAAEGAEKADTRSHIVAATMALVYSWLKKKLHENRKSIPELKKEIYILFDERKEENVTKLCEKIYPHFSKEEKEVTAEIREVFHYLNMEKSDLPTNIDTLFDDILGIEEAAFNAPIQDLARGIGYLMDGYEVIHYSKSNDYIGFLNRILRRFENEKIPENDSEIIEAAKERINRRIQQLEYVPEPEPSIPNLTFDSISIPEDDEPEIDPEIKDYIGWIAEPQIAVKIIDTLKSYMIGKDLNQPRYVLMPLCAALECELIRKPSEKEYNKVFKEFPIKSTATQLNDWVSEGAMKEYKKQIRYKPLYNTMLDAFMKLK